MPGDTGWQSGRRDLGIGMQLAEDAPRYAAANKLKNLTLTRLVRAFSCAVGRPALD